MKKIFIYILCAAAITAASTSCDAILEKESPSTFDGSVVFANYDLAQSTIFGIVEAFCEVNSYRGRFLPWYGFNTDIEWYNAYSAGKAMDGKNEIASYGILPNNTQMDLSNGPYNLMYTAIERANLTIEGLRQYGNVSSDKDMAYLLGEALTLRAMIYYDLIKAWGDVPARFESITADNMYVGKASRDVIFKQILKDLDDAIPYLYLPGESAATQKTDRINKLFAEGLYARIALAASGSALRPDDGKVGTGDPGTVRLSSDAELSKAALYPKALVYLKDAIASGKGSLVDYETLWRNFNSFDLSAGKEILYVIPFSDGRGRWNYTFAIKNEGASINGYSFSQGGQAGPVPSFYFKYDDNDVRKDLTCVNYSWAKSGDIEPAGIAKWYFGKYRFEWMDKNPYTGGNDDGAKPVVMRWSDILLMAAEIENEINNGPTNDAKDWFLQVRSRAFKGHESEAEAYVAALSDKDKFFNAIVDERAFEFCGEFLRKGDLIRWGLLKSKLDEAKADMLDLRDKKGDFAWLSGDIWYKLADDEESLQIWGLKKAEQSAPAGEWDAITGYVKYDDSKKSDLYAEKIENIYINDPEQFMFWPIFSNTISNSQGLIVNDYGYTN